ncbi:MAG: transposase [Granulicella sp.]
MTGCSQALCRRCSHEHRNSQHSKTLRLPTFSAQIASLAEEAAQRNHTHLHYLEALHQAVMEYRKRRAIELRIQEPHLPRMKTLEELDFAQSLTSRQLASAPWPKEAISNVLDRSLVGNPGSGKTQVPQDPYRACFADDFRSHRAHRRTLCHRSRDARQHGGNLQKHPTSSGKTSTRQLRTWPVVTLEKLSRKSDSAVAIRYALSRWGALTCYVDDGQLEINNNAAEGALRVVAFGRKNVLFAGS